MKLSVNIPNPLNRTARIYLNGVLQKYVVEADEEEGYIIKYADPKVIMRDDLLTHKLWGKVEITFGNK